MINVVKTEKRKRIYQQAASSVGKNKDASRQTGFINMNEARQIAELVFSGIALSG